MTKKTIGVLLIMSLVMFIGISAVSAADTNDTSIEGVSDTDIATASVAFEQDANDVEQIGVNDNQDEISYPNAADASSDLGAAMDCGDKYYLPDASIVNGDIDKIVPNITVRDVVVNYPDEIKINVTVDVPDNYTVSLGNESLSLYVENSAIFTFQSEGFKPDSYEIVAYVAESEDHAEAYGHATLTINKGRGFFNLSKDLIEYGENGTITVTAPVNAYGNISYKVYDGYVDLIYSITQSCREKLVVPNLDVGRFMVTGTFEGDSYYTRESRVNSGLVFVIAKRVSLTVTASNITYGENATVNVLCDVDGEYLVRVGNQQFVVAVVNGTGNVSVSNLTAGIYDVDVTVVDDDHYSGSASISFEVIKSKADVDIDFENETCGLAPITLKLPQDADGTVTVYVNNVLSQIANLVNGSATIIISNLNVGHNNVSVVYGGNDNYNSFNKSVVIIRNATIIAYDMTRGYNSGLDYTARLLDSYGFPLANANVTIKVDTVMHVVQTDSDGIFKFNDKLAPGDYAVVIVNPINGEYKLTNLKIVKRITGNKNLAIFFADGTKYKVRAIGDDGSPVGAEEVVKINVGGKTYSVKTDKNGYANLKLSLKVKKHTIAVTYKGFTTKNKVTVKSVVKPVKKTVTVKKTAKNLKIKVKLKGKKVLKNKRVSLKFNGKTYNAKTNKKGVATFKVSKKVIKKLKKGKKYKAVFTYKAKANGKTIKDTAKCNVKVK